MTIYENDYTQMLLDIVPFIQDEIMPALKAMSETTKERMLSAVKQTKRPLFSNLMR